MQTSLATRGFRVETVPRTQRRLLLTDVGRFDVIVLDLTGPEMQLPQMPGRSKGPADAEFVVIGDRLSFAELSETLGCRRFLMLNDPRGTGEVVAAVELALRQRQLESENRALRARLDDAEERRAADRLASFRAHHDPVTRLPNRVLLNDRLNTAIAQARRNRRKLALMFLDLDGFKAVNDSLGHDLGDRLLRAVAERLQGCVRRSDTLARYGGDEFALLLPDVRAREDAALIAGKILGCLGDPFLVAGRRLTVGASIGIALYPEAGGLGEMLIRRADIAMYHVKSRGKNAYRFFSEDMDPAGSGQLATGRELHAGLIRGELEVFYRPRVSLQTGCIATVEAQWRWRHPERGLVKPEDIVPAPNGDDSIAAVDDFLHRRAFQQTSQWRHRNSRSMAVAIDLPAARLAETEFVGRLLGNLAAPGLDAAAVTVQIEENALMQGAENIAPLLDDLRGRGVHAFVRDFGAGFSSLRDLERLRLRGLKLAPSLLRAADGVAVVQEGTPVREGTPTLREGTPTPAGRDTHNPGCGKGHPPNPAITKRGHPPRQGGHRPQPAPERLPPSPRQPGNSDLNSLPQAWSRRNNSPS